MISNWPQPKLNKVRESILSSQIAEKPMEDTHKERYDEIDDQMILYTRTIPVISGPGMVWFDVQVYMSRNFLKMATAEQIKQYQNRAVAAILTRNGINDA